MQPTSFFRGDMVTAKRESTKQWNAHCVVDGTRKRGTDSDVILDVHEVTALLNSAGTDR